MSIRTRTVVLLGVLGLLVVGGVLLARDARALRPVLGQIETDLERARTAVEEGDTEAARTAITAAESGVARARPRADGPWWAAARLIPHYGASARAVTDGVDLAAATVDLAVAGLTEALALVEEGAAAFVGPGGVIETTALADVAEALDALPVAPLRDARDRLADLPASGLLGPTRDARNSAVRRATAVIDQVERAGIGARTFAGFLGAEESRTYLLAVQNPAELRGTGGLLSVLAELTVDAGRFDVRATRGQELVADRITTGGQQTVGFNLDPVDRPQEFADRYDFNAGGAIIQSVNLDPDLPTVAPVLIELYGERTGGEVDGVVLMDPFALAELVEATGGPLPMPPAALAEAPTLPAELTGENIPRTLLIDVYDAYGGDNPARNDLDDALTLAVLGRLRSGTWEPAVLARALADAAAARRLQLYSEDVDEQAGLLALGIAGQLTRPDTIGDVLAVTAVNAGPDKSDAHVAHLLAADVRLTARPGAVPWQVVRETTTTVEVVNPLRPGDHDDYITGTSEPTPIGERSPPRVRDALNRTWFQIWAPDTTELRALRDGINGEVLRTATIHGHRAIDYFLETPSASTASFSAPFSGPLDLQRVGGRYVYELQLWRQAKAIPDIWDLTVQAPSGLRFEDVQIVGGGPSATGLGAVEAEPLNSFLTPDEFRLRGGVTRDLTIRLAMTPG